MIEVLPKVELLDYTKNAERNVAISAKLTHSKEGLEKLDKKMSKEEVKKIVRHMIKLGHTSTLEHSFYYFKVACSRTCSHQIVRHRIGTGFSQRSERYVDNGELEVIVPHTIKENPEAYEDFIHKCIVAEKQYNKFRELGIPKEDARFILPRIKTELAFSLNGRALRHFINLRMDKHAQWEIRDIATRMYEQVKNVTPNIVYGL
jgi:thymidylate synthase (FAD)